MPPLRHGSRRTASAALVLAQALVVLAAAPVAAWAHVPVLEPDRHGAELPIRSPDVSMALYGYLAPSEAFDSYAFEVPRATETTVGIIVPVRDDLAAFHPAVAIVEPDGTTILELESRPGRARPVFFEPFSLQSFHQGPEASVSLRPGVRYRLEVDKPPRRGVTSGDYVVTFSGPERFDGRDTFRTLTDLPRIWLGLYGGGPVRPGALAVFALLVMAFAGIIGLARRRSRGHRFARR